MFDLREVLEFTRRGAGHRCSSPSIGPASYRHQAWYLQSITIA